ncbi:STAS-like domain-containing protein [Xanthomonas citri pv. glycines]|nr:MULTISPECIES: STAS-like domain-containing protein [Xanthomonas]MCC5075674.1 STAS-like domain-containing protein [Xanthomonas campestris pv. campestris]MEB1048185.1 STAS-like domain-containing protein [Xanthomonas campestris pv. campestris]QTK38066.1 STAS-like domain-containing protein [Xanthomonas citri pv. glycines]
MKSTMFNVAKSFSRFPGGRRKDHGQFSGEEFRNKVTIPLLDSYDHVTFDLSGTVGYSSGFLDEAFGEIGKILGISEAKRRVTILAQDDPEAVETVWLRISEASAESR